MLLLIVNSHGKQKKGALMKPSNQQATDGLRALLLDSTHINWISPLLETLNRDIKEALDLQEFCTS